MSYLSTATRPARHPVFAMPPVERSARLAPLAPPTPQRSLARARLVAVLVTIIFIMVIVAPKVGADSGPVPTTRHHVAPGETLWNLASAMTPQGESVWDYVAILKDLNNLDSSSLQVDQVLLLPASSQ